MIKKHELVFACILLVNIFLRGIFITYGYISSEEGILIYGQKLAYLGLLPFIHYNAWNSLLNNYLIGFSQIFISPTIISQRVVALSLSITVFFLVLYICKNVRCSKYLSLAAFLLTFGSFSYLYNSTIPSSEQMMTLSLLISLALLSRTITVKKNSLYWDAAAFVFALLAFPIRPQALPGTILIWIYIMVRYQEKLKQFYFITTIGALFLLVIYLPFILGGWDNFVYSIIWPLKAQQILVYQAPFTHFEWIWLIPFTINVVKEYMVLFTLLGTVVILKLFTIKQTVRELLMNSTHQYIFFSVLVGTSIASLSFIHRPPYSTYIYPTVPIFVYVCVFYIARLMEKIKISSLKTVKVLLYGLLAILAVQYLLIFPHTDYMKTSLATITKPPYIQLKEIHRYIESKTSPGSEILSFYVPTVAQLNRIIPIDLNEGEGSISILSDPDSRKYHLTNINMLRNYISSKRAQAIVMTTNTPNFFGVNGSEKQLIMKTITDNYILDKSFTNFAQIGNPRVSTLYVYLIKP